MSSTLLRKARPVNIREAQAQLLKLIRSQSPSMVLSHGKPVSFLIPYDDMLDLVEFLDELKDAGKRMDADMQKKYEELKVSAERFRKEASNKERWKEVEEGLKKAGEELEKTVKAAFKKREPKS